MKKLSLLFLIATIGQINCGDAMSAEEIIPSQQQISNLETAFSSLFNKTLNLQSQLEEAQAGQALAKIHAEQAQADYKKLEEEILKLEVTAGSLVKELAQKEALLAAQEKAARVEAELAQIGTLVTKQEEALEMVAQEKAALVSELAQTRTLVTRREEALAKVEQENKNQTKIIENQTKIIENQTAQAQADYRKLGAAFIGLGAFSALSHTQIGKDLGSKAGMYGVRASKAALTSATTLTTQAAHRSLDCLTSYVIPAAKSGAQVGSKVIAKSGIGSKAVDVTNTYIVPPARETLNFLTSQDTLGLRLCCLPFGLLAGHYVNRKKKWKEPFGILLAVPPLVAGCSAVAQVSHRATTDYIMPAVKTAASVASATTTNYVIPTVKNTASSVYNISCDVVAPAVKTATQELVEILKSRDARYHLIPLGAIGAIKISPYISGLVKKSCEGFKRNLDIQANYSGSLTVYKNTIDKNEKSKKEAELKFLENAGIYADSLLNKTSVAE